MEIGEQIYNNYRHAVCSYRVHEEWMKVATFYVLTVATVKIAVLRRRYYATPKHR